MEFRGTYDEVAYASIGPGPGVETDTGTIGAGHYTLAVVIAPNSGGVDDVSLVLRRKAECSDRGGPADGR